MAERIYALHNLYEDQEPDLVADTVPAVLAWLGPSSDAAEPSSSFKVRLASLGEPGARATEDVALTFRSGASRPRSRCCCR
jgi:hypothetical protein